MIAVPPFNINIFDDVIYICFVDGRRAGTHFIKKIKFPRCERKKILKYIEEVIIANPSSVELFDFKGTDGITAEDSPQD